MAWTSPRTWTAGEAPTAATFNTHVRDNLNYLYDAPYAAVIATSTQSLTNTTETLITFATEIDDNDSMVNLGTSSSRITIVTPGVYEIIGRVSYAANSTGSREGYLTKNGVSTGSGTRIAGIRDTAHTSVHTIIVTHREALVAGDYINLEGYQSSTAALNTSVATGLASFLSAAWIRA